MTKRVLKGGEFHHRNEDGTVTVFGPSDVVEMTKEQEKSFSDLLHPPGFSTQVVAEAPEPVQEAVSSGVKAKPASKSTDTGEDDIEDSDTE